MGIEIWHKYYSKHLTASNICKSNEQQVKTLGFKQQFIYNYPATSTDATKKNKVQPTNKHQTCRAPMITVIWYHNLQFLWRASHQVQEDLKLTEVAHLSKNSTRLTHTRYNSEHVKANTHLDKDPWDMVEYCKWIGKLSSDVPLLLAFKSYKLK